MFNTEWELYKNHCYKQPLNPAQEQELKQAFLSGMAVMYAELTSKVSALEDEAAMARLKEIDQDLVFNMSLLATAARLRSARNN